MLYSFLQAGRDKGGLWWQYSAGRQDAAGRWSGLDLITFTYISHQRGTSKLEIRQKYNRTSEEILIRSELTILLKLPATADSK